MEQLKYCTGILEIINQINETQADKIRTAAKWCAETIASGKMVHLFGSGHSVLPIQDMFPRYGGVVGWHPLMDPRLMWSNVIGPGGARELLWIERQEGYIKNFLQSYNLQAGEVLIVYSHGGLNAAPIEAALYAKEKGLKVIVVTSGDNYEKAQATHSSGKMLGDVADLMISNCCPLEDSLVEIPNYPQKVGASSTVGAIVITQSIASETALKLQKMGHEMFIFVSPNVTECPPDYMHQVYDNYTKLVRKCGN
ncbi:sugar isomerase domain-containing protein [Clostridiales bacterium COT073_COT-073]|nr:sugar isomerase domain-containing protein [Clostridiales bacterium COT073_COT-073]